jgi:hypothetical protein
MIGALIQFVRLESQKLDAQTAALRQAIAAAETSATATVTVTTITTE